MAQLGGAATVDQLHDEIRGVRYREATSTFCRLVTEEKRSIKDTIKDAIAAAAPYVQVLWRDNLGENGASIRMRRGGRARSWSVLAI